MYLTKLVNAHGSRYPQLIEVQHLFEQIRFRHARTYAKRRNDFISFISAIKFNRYQKVDPEIHL